jgi:hypothetical protein
MSKYLPVMLQTEKGPMSAVMNSGGGGSGGLPAGGAVGNLISKNSATDGDASWKTPDAAGVVAKSGNQFGIAGNKTWSGDQNYSATNAHTGGYVTYAGTGVIFNAGSSLEIGKNSQSGGTWATGPMLIVFSSTGDSSIAVPRATNVTDKWVINPTEHTLTLNPTGWTTVRGRTTVLPGEFVRLIPFGTILYIVHLGNIEA